MSLWSEHCCKLNTNQYKIIVYSFKFICSVIATYQYQDNNRSQKFTYLPGLRGPEPDPEVTGKFWINQLNHSSGYWSSTFTKVKESASKQNKT